MQGTPNQALHLTATSGVGVIPQASPRQVSLVVRPPEASVARWWSEPLDPERHRDFMSTCHVGGLPLEPSRDRLIERRVYFVEAAGFIFQFASLDQLRAALAYFGERVHPSSREPGVALEHYWQRWFERLPQWLSEEPRRVRVVSALSRALRAFEPGAAG